MKNPINVSNADPVRGSRIPNADQAQDQAQAYLEARRGPSGWSRLVWTLDILWSMLVVILVLLVGPGVAFEDASAALATLVFWTAPIFVTWVFTRLLRWVIQGFRSRD